MNKFIIIFALFFISLPSFADMVLTGGIFTVESAREELIQNRGEGIDSAFIKNNLYDPQRKENISYLLTGKTELKDRTLAKFSDNTYAVMYKNDELHVLYYSADGTLLYAEEKDSTRYPYKSYKYNTGGKLVNMGLRVSKAETFIYSPDGKLIAHWIGAKGYDADNNVIMTRKYSE